MIGTGLRLWVLGQPGFSLPDECFAYLVAICLLVSLHLMSVQLSF